MNSQTSVKSVWNRIRKIKGKDTSNTVHHLSVNDRDVMLFWGCCFFVCFLMLLGCCCFFVGLPTLYFFDLFPV